MTILIGKCTSVVTLPGRTDSLGNALSGRHDTNPSRLVSLSHTSTNRLHIAHLPHFEALFEPSSIRRLSTDHRMLSPIPFLRLVNGFGLHPYSCR